jgi:hypothetical protein
MARRRKARRSLGAFVPAKKPGASSRAGREAHALARSTGRRAYWCLDEKRDGYVIDTKPHGPSCSSWAPASGLGRVPRKKSGCGCGRNR